MPLYLAQIHLFAVEHVGQMLFVGICTCLVILWCQMILLVQAVGGAAIFVQVASGNRASACLR